jgi:hypothetical protein
MLLQNGGCVVEQAAHAGKAVPRTIATETAIFAVINIFRSPNNQYGNPSIMASYFRARFRDGKRPIATSFSFKNYRCASTAKPARQGQAIIAKKAEPRCCDSAFSIGFVQPKSIANCAHSYGRPIGCFVASPPARPPAACPAAAGPPPPGFPPDGFAACGLTWACSFLTW